MHLPKIIRSRTETYNQCSIPVTPLPTYQSLFLRALDGI